MARCAVPAAFSGGTLYWTDAGPKERSGFDGVSPYRVLGGALPC